MAVVTATDSKSPIKGGKRKKSVIELLFEGRAFFALILIVAVFSVMSPTWLVDISCTDRGDSKRTPSIEPPRRIVSRNRA